jgi:large subunit ribosomal protein L15
MNTKLPTVVEKSKKRLGRGHGSGKVKTAGRGTKGQKAKGTIRMGFEGGQTPLFRRIPKRGFNHSSKIIYEPINLIVLEAHFKAGDEINGDVLFKKGVIKNSSLPVKILGIGKLTKALKVTANRFSKSAEKAIKAAGGTSSLVAKSN